MAQGFGYKSQFSFSAFIIKASLFSVWRQYILEIIHMVLDGLYGLPVINLPRCINDLVNFKFIFIKKKENISSCDFKLLRT